MNPEKNTFALPDFVGSEIAICGLTSLTDFYERVVNSLRHQKLLLVGNHFQDNSFLFEINREDIGLSKLLSQFELLPSLF